MKRRKLNVLVSGLIALCWLTVALISAEASAEEPVSAADVRWDTGTYFAPEVDVTWLSSGLDRATVNPAMTFGVGDAVADCYSLIVGPEHPADAYPEMEVTLTVNLKDGSISKLKTDSDELESCLKRAPEHWHMAHTGDGSASATVLIPGSESMAVRGEAPSLLTLKSIAVEVDLACFANLAEKDRAGEVLVEYVVGARGLVTEAHAERTDFPASVTDCAVNVVSEAHFPPVSEPVTRQLAVRPQNTAPLGISSEDESTGKVNEVFKP